MVRQAAQLRGRGEFRGRRQLRLRQVEVEHLQHRRADQVAPPGTGCRDACGPPIALPPEKRDQVGAVREEARAGSPRGGSCAAASTSTGTPRGMGDGGDLGQRGPLFGPASQ